MIFSHAAYHNQEMLLVLLSITALWLLLPFFPAFIELRSRRDAEPLPIADRYEEEMQHAPAQFIAALAMTAGQDNATRPVPLDLANLPRPGDPSAKAPYLLEESGAEPLPAGLLFTKEVLAKTALHTGPNSAFEAIYGENDLHLGEGNTVALWLHGEANVWISAGTHLHGSASALQEMVVEKGCTFERLHAANLLFGVEPALKERPLGPETLIPLALENEAGVPDHRLLICRDLTIPAGHVVEGNLVITESLHLERDARIIGDVKAHRSIVLEEGARVEGHVFSEKDVRLGAETQVTGVVVAERRLTLSRGCRVGALGRASTACGRYVDVAAGVQVHGTVWALERGRVTQ